MRRGRSKKNWVEVGRGSEKGRLLRMRGRKEEGRRVDLIGRHVGQIEGRRVGKMLSAQLCCDDAINLKVELEKQRKEQNVDRLSIKHSAY